MPTRLLALLSVSLLLNVLLIAGRMMSPSSRPAPPAATPAVLPGSVEKRDVAMTSTTGSRRTIASAAPDRPVTEQARAVREALLEAGVDEPSMRRLVTQLIHLRFAQSQLASPWWQNSPMGSSSLRVLPAARQREIETLIKDVLGGRDDESTLAFLKQFPEDKREAVRTILGDYAEMQRDTYADMQGFQMPQDQERLRFLEEEMRKDLRSLLSSEEYARVEVAWVPAGHRAKMVASQLDLSEAEFWQVYATRRQLDAEGDTGAAAGNEREARFNAWLVDTFGRERIDQASLRNSRDYTVLENARERLGFPQETFDAVLALRQRAEVVSGEVASMSASATEKRTALKQAAGAIRSELVTLLGDKAAQAYLGQNAMGWIDNMERGQTVRFLPSGYADATPVK